MLRRSILTVFTIAVLAISFGAHAALIGFPISRVDLLPSETLILQVMGTDLNQDAWDAQFVDEDQAASMQLFDTLSVGASNDAGINFQVAEPTFSVVGAVGESVRAQLGSDELDSILVSSTSNLQAVSLPVPAAVWLFGSALGLLGWIKRKAT